MGFLRKLILFGFVLGIILIVVRTLASDSSEDQATLFLNKLREGDINILVPQFGENSCHCQPRGGYLAYLKYESGERDNLAFLLGHPFTSGAYVVKPVPTIMKYKGGEMPWEKPESVEIDVPINFDKGQYSPYFLPMDMAYGYAMKDSELEPFCKDPSNDFSNNLALRLRPSLNPGLISKPAPPDPNRKPEFSADLYKEMLPAEQAKYLRPADAGQVLDAAGKPKAMADVEKELPRLKSGILRLYIGRRAEFKRWAVKKVRLKDPVFELKDGKELALKTPEEALLDPVNPLKEENAAPEEENMSQ